MGWTRLGAHGIPKPVRSIPWTSLSPRKVVTCSAFIDSMLVCVPELVDAELTDLDGDELAKSKSVRLWISDLTTYSGL
jgi:hypothetical protein